MSLEDFIDNSLELDDKYNKFNKLKEKYLQKGLPENIAIYKASYILTPDKLEKIKLIANNEEGIRPNIIFCFDTEEELKLVGKYFNYNPNIGQVKNSKLLIEILKELDKLDGKI